MGKGAAAGSAFIHPDWLFLLEAAAVGNVVGALDEVDLLLRGKVLVVFDEFVGEGGEVVDDGGSWLFSL
jgi:hypothetical protein